MKIRSRELRAVGWWLAAACCLLGVGTVGAEVGVVDDSAPTTIYVLGIIEDIDPVPSVWRTFAAEQPGRKILNPEGEQNGDGPPSILFNAQFNLAIAVWAKNLPGGYDVVMSRYANGAWSAPQVLAGSPANERDPVLALDPSDGSVHLLYWIDDATPRVMYMLSPADLSSWSAPLLVSGQGEVACRPSAMFHDGLLRVAYEVHDLGYGMTPRQIVFATYDGQIPFLTENLAVTSYAGANRPEVHSAGGKLWVDWIDSEGEMGWTRQQPSGSWTPVAVESFGTIEQREYHVRGAIKFQATQ